MKCVDAAASHNVTNGGSSIRVCHPEQSEGSASCSELQIPRFARDDNLLRCGSSAIPDPSFTIVATPDPPPSTLPRCPSTLCEIPAPQTRHRNFAPGPSGPDAIQTTTADSGDFSIDPPGTPAPRLSHPRSSATLRPA